MKSIKYLVVLACMTFGLASIAKAQIYCNEVCYYVKSTDKLELLVVKFEGSKNRILVKYYLNSNAAYHMFKKKIESSKNYFENDKVWEIAYNEFNRSSNEKPVIWEYDSQLSTSSREVYKGISDSEYKRIYNVVTSNHERQKFAFSKDLSSLIRFNTNHPDSSKTYWTRVFIEDLLPKAINPNELDFLNE